MYLVLYQVQCTTLRQGWQACGLLLYLHAIATFTAAARALWWYMRGDAIQDRTRPAVYSIPCYRCGRDVLLLLHACKHVYAVSRSQ